MNTLGRAGLRFLKRHAEALLIAAFLLADCFLSGWLLVVGGAAWAAYVVVPAVASMWRLDARGQLTYLKAFVRTPKFQRLAIGLFWLFGIRWLISCIMGANLFTSALPPSLTNSLILGAQQFAPLSFLATPVVFYAASCLVAIAMRARLKATKQDPDLIEQRKAWAGVTHTLFMASFVLGILSITMNKAGPAYMMSNWLLASARDANLFGGEAIAPDAYSISADSPAQFPIANPHGAFWAPMLTGVGGYKNGLEFIPYFDTFVISAMSLAAYIFLLPHAVRLGALLTSFCWRVVSPKSLQNIIEGFLEALRLPSRSVAFREAHPFLNNALRTLMWLVGVYAVVFWLCGFCGGPLGTAIENWMLASAVDAGFGTADDPPKWLFEPGFRIFLGSVVAMYATAPLAVTGAVFLPFAKQRVFTLNVDGILFAQGPYLSLFGRQFRLWSDLKSLTVKPLNPTAKEAVRAQFTLTFRSGGWIKFDTSQVAAPDIKILLDGIDEHAVSCAVAPDVFATVEALLEQHRESNASDGKTDSAIASLPAEQFKSTIFVPFVAGDLLPNTQIRIIRQLASKPLCAVYLGRDENGRMVIVKQFYLADETDETKALEKMLKREYDLLSRLDHPSIAKVVNCFSEDKSTYLVIEHRVGNDLRATVNEHGPRSEALTIAWAKQVCEIMIYLHSGEPAILHRDLTPDNLIAGEDGQLRLIDFGAAREFLEGITGTMIGKHCYVSPEQLRGEATKLSDIYSFGGTLYFVLTGRDPIALSQSCPAKNMDVSEELDQLIRDCTEFEQENRPQSFQEILRRLDDMDRGIKIKIPASKEAVTA
jgi:hypothetical protein